MKKALIAPMQQFFSGVRIAQVSDSAFEVAEPLFWVDVEDNVTAEKFCYDLQNNVPVAIPEPVLPDVQAADQQPTSSGLETV